MTGTEAASGTDSTRAQTGAGPEAPTDHMRLLAAIEAHVPFDGFSAAALAAAAADLGLAPGQVARLAPRGAPGLAADLHRRGDQRLKQTLAARDLSGLRFRDRIALAVRLRLEGEDREVIRRAVVLFALPQHLAEGSRLMWETADSIWTALGDTSDDVNWYSKRLTLSGVHSATLLYWLGDASEGSAETWAFLDRRIGDVMRIEEAKTMLRKAPLIGNLMAHPLNPLNRLKAPGHSTAPGQAPGTDWRRRWPGHWSKT